VRGRLDYGVPRQDLTISLRRVPAIVRSRFLISVVHAATPHPHESTRTKAGAEYSPV
jgi:hypothetical protein